MRPSFHIGQDDMPPAALKFGGAEIPILLPNVFSLTLNCGTFSHQRMTFVSDPIHRKRFKAAAI